MTLRTLGALVIGTVLVGWAAGSAVAQDGGAANTASPPAQSPYWIRRPGTPGTDQSECLDYPARAQRMGIEGHVMLDCRIESTGKLGDCRVTSEAPADYEFGDTALCMARLFKMRAASKDGVSAVGRRISVPIEFRLPAG